MGEALSIRRAAATHAGDRFAVTATDTSVSDFWFPPIAQALLGKGSGEQLCALTGFDARTCWRYAPKEKTTKPVQPPGFFIVALLRSEQGGVWLRAFMDEHKPRWWREFLTADAHLQKLEEIRALIER